MCRILRPGQQAQLHRLPAQRVRAGDDRLAGDHSRGGRKQDHRQPRPVRIHEEERVIQHPWIAQHQRPLAEIIDDQRRQNEEQPGDLNRLAAEMAEIGVKRLGAGDGKKYGAQRQQTDKAVADQEAQGKHRVEGEQYLRVAGDRHHAGDGQCDEPDAGYGAEEGGHLRGAARLHHEQRDQDDDRQRQDERLKRRLDDLEAFHRRQDGQGRRDHRIAVEERRRDDTEHRDQRRRAPEALLGERHQGQRAALTAVVGAGEDQHVFDRHDDDQGPEDEREDAQHTGGRDASVTARGDPHRLAKGVEGARADIAIDDTDGPDSQSPETDLSGDRISAVDDRLVRRTCCSQWQPLLHRNTRREAPSSINDNGSHRSRVPCDRLSLGRSERH